MSENTTENTKEEAQLPIITYKGFDKDLACNPNGTKFQYEVGKTYELDGDIEACRRGFHACEYPLDVFRYYAPSGNRFCQTEQSGKISRHDDDTKVASSVIKVGIEIGIDGLVKAAIEYTLKRCAPIDPESPAQASGYQGAAQASGYQGAAQASGDQGAAQASGYQGAAQAGGDQGAAQASGYQGAAQAEGKHSTAAATGFYGKAKGIEGTALFLVRRDDESVDEKYARILFARAFIVGQDGINPNVFYTLDEKGEPVEVIDE